MKKFDARAFIEFVVDNRVVGFFDKPITLKSGRRSHWYVNWRAVSNDVFLMDRLSDFLLDFVSDLNLTPDSIYGVPEGATKLGVLSTYKWAKAQKSYAIGSHVLSMGRGKPKEHGISEDRFFVGMPKGNIVVVEDVTTTGGSLLETLDQLSKIDVKVIATIGLTNRMEKRDDGKSVAEVMSERGVPYFSLCDATVLLPKAIEALKPNEAIKKLIEEEFI